MAVLAGHCTARDGGHERVSGHTVYAAGGTEEGEKEPAGLLQTRYPGHGEGMGGTEAGGGVRFGQRGNGYLRQTAQ